MFSWEKSGKDKVLQYLKNKQKPVQIFLMLMKITFGFVKCAFLELYLQPQWSTFIKNHTDST